VDLRALHKAECRLTDCSADGAYNDRNKLQSVAARMHSLAPHLAGELPSGLDRLSFVWERGTKLFE